MPRVAMPKFSSGNGLAASRKEVTVTLLSSKFLEMLFSRIFRDSEEQRRLNPKISDSEVVNF